jgi:hypothetical protein
VSGSRILSYAPQASVKNRLMPNGLRASLKIGLDRARDLRDWERHILQ